MITRIQVSSFLPSYGFSNSLHCSDLVFVKFSFVEELSVCHIFNVQLLFLCYEQKGRIHAFWLMNIREMLKYLSGGQTVEEHFP